MGTDEALTADETAALEAYKSGSDIPAAPASPDQQTPAGGQPEANLDQIADELTGTNEEIAGDDPDDAIVVAKTRNEKGQFVKTVPLGALHKERKTHQATKTELAALREQQTKLQSKWDMLHELAGVTPKSADGGSMAPVTPQTPNPFDDPDIDPEVDVVGALKQQKARNAFMREQTVAQEKERQTRDAQMTVANTYLNDAKRLVSEQISKGEVVDMGGKQVPALHAAYSYLVNLRHVQLESLGVSDQAERSRMIATEEREMAQRAIANNQSPAAMIYKFAQASGFKLNPVAAVDPNKLAANQQRIANVKQGMAAAASLSGSGQSGDSLTIDKIANMNEDQFASFTKGLDRAKLKELLGG